MHDGIELEKRGIPTAVICTDQFIPTGKAMARIKGLPDYPFITLPHPTGSLPPERLRQSLEEALPKVLPLLIKP